jgi:hypothetical protein
MNFYPHFSHLLSNVNKILYKTLHVTLLNICEFLYTRGLEGHTFTTGVSETALRPLPLLGFVQHWLVVC